MDEKDFTIETWYHFPINRTKPEKLYIHTQATIDGVLFQQVDEYEDSILISRTLTRADRWKG